MTRPRVLHVSRLYVPATGGTETYIRRLVARLPAEGFDCEVLTLDRYLYDLSVQFPAREKVDDTWVTRIPHFGPKQFPLAPQVLAHARQFDLVHVHGTDFFLSYLALTRFLHGKPLVLNTHGGIFHIRRRWWAKMIYLHTLLRASIRAVDTVISDGQADTELFGQVSRDMVEIPPGVDVDLFANLPRVPEPGLCLSLSRLQPSKRIERMIGLIARLKPTHPHLKLLVVGPDTHGIRPSLERTAREAGVGEQVEFAGEVDDARLREILSRVQFFMSASEYEGWGVSACEALAAGIPCLLQRIPTFAKIGEDNAGVQITDFADAGAAAADFRRLLDEPAEAYQRRADAGRMAVKRFSLEAAAKATADVYRRILHRAPSRP